MQRANAKRHHYHGGPAVFSSKTGSFASPPRDGFALYYVSTVTSTSRQTLGLHEKNIFMFIKQLRKYKPPVSIQGAP
jgi:hypothetical protein